MLPGMDRVLLLITATSYKAGAFLEAARRLEVAVTVGSDRPQALAELNPAGSLMLDFAEPGDAVREIEAFARLHPVHAVVAADDDGALLAALAAQALGLPAHPPDAVRAAGDKLLTRERLKAAGLPTPWFERLALGEDPEVAAIRMRFPCVLKPLALAGSRGVMRADDPAAFAACFRRLAVLLGRSDARRADGAAAKAVLAEGYIPGREVAIEGLLTRGRLRVLAIFDKPDPLEGPFFEETIYVTPTRLGLEERRAVVECAQAAIRALGLVHGPVHAELRLNQHGAWALEIAPRTIGGLCSRAVRFEDGVSLEELVLRHALGRATDTLERERQASGVMMIPITARGRLEGVRGVEEAREVPGVAEVRIGIPPGQWVEPLPEGARFLGFIFARGAGASDAEVALREAHRKLSFDIQPSGD
jgi:biotin carboxylase